MITLPVFEASPEVRAAVERMRRISLTALKRMFVPDEGMFCHCIRRGPEGDVPEGMSRRYTAITLIALAETAEEIATDVLAGQPLRSVCDRLIGDVQTVQNLGDVALTLWAAATLGHEGAPKALRRLIELDPVTAPYPTVEIAWTLTALSVAPNFITDESLAQRVADRLKSSFHPRSNLFPHWPEGAAPSAWRAHVSCFADWVYPVQALSHHHRASGDQEGIEMARRSAETMCRMQGAGGQWWWHFDVRTGRVVERYPVYSVHQDAMAPMALFALKDACGQDHSDAVRRGLQWLACSAERGDSLVDEEAGLIWRKVARREPAKLCRGIQAMASRLHRSFRVSGLDALFPPTAIDYECRPYHLGWLLYAFSDGRMDDMSVTG